MALPPGLLMSRLNSLQHERAAEPEETASATAVPNLAAPSAAPPPPPRAVGGEPKGLFGGGGGGGVGAGAGAGGGGGEKLGNTDFFASIAGIISAAGI